MINEDMEKDYSYPNCYTNKLIHINETGDQYYPPKSDKNRLYQIDYIFSKDGEDTGLLPIVL